MASNPKRSLRIVSAYKPVAGDFIAMEFLPSSLEARLQRGGFSLGQVGLQNPRRTPNYLGQNTHRHRPLVRCVYLPLKSTLIPLSLPPLAVCFRKVIQLLLLYRWKI